jgi:hypothetical protein
MRDTLCSNCDHLFDAHALVTLKVTDMTGIGEVPAAGLVLCPDCSCVTTWSVDAYPAPTVPAEQIAAIRNEVFGG